MLVGRCSWELSGRKLHRKIKRSQTPSEAPHRFIAWYSAGWRGVEEPVLSVVEGTPKVLISSMLFGAFRLPKPEN
ncbi:MAG: hypothetical protein QOI94_348 [Acidobacteriaceae bacterium]|jgi:hypothetical protein|nr:hypothetical protein [Acidobacteriaceae bacterium]